MTVEELIAILQKMNPKAAVLIDTENMFHAEIGSLTSVTLDAEGDICLRAD